MSIDDGNGHELPAIPILECGPDFPMATLMAFENRAHALIDGATSGLPKSALQIADRISKRWLVKSKNAHLDEIDTIAAQLGRPGAYFLSVNYEWGCTVAVRTGGTHPELVRVLDWRTPGLGKHIIAANVLGDAGAFVTLTWPGYTGVLQAMAPNRFAAAINQAPMPSRGGGLLPLDWLVNKTAVWQSNATTPAHLLRRVFETASSYSEARSLLSALPIAAPAIFSLVGTNADELTVIERTESATHVHDGQRAAANAWTTPNWTGRARGNANTERARQLSSLRAMITSDFDWLQSPTLNPLTRLAAVFTPAAGRLLAQGYAGAQPATACLTQCFLADAPQSTEALMD